MTATITEKRIQKVIENKKYFVVSDVHNGYTPLKIALTQKGFDIKNKNHHLIVCGDAFDRLNEARAVLKFLQELKKLNRLILLKGNHDYLMWDCLREINEYGVPKGYHHYSNGTVGTIAQFANDTDVTFKLNNWQTLSFEEIEKINRAMIPWKSLVQDAINYYEEGDYIFVHGWIPCKKIYKTSYDGYDVIEYLPKWRELPDYSSLWEAASWIGYPSALDSECWEPNKIIVTGHWNSSQYNAIQDNDEPFPTKKIGVNWQHVFRPAIHEHFIAIDGCTAYSGIVNMLVFEEDKPNHLILIDSKEILADD